jgi:hypothetical protein
MHSESTFATAVQKRQETIRRFRQLVNLSAPELEAWLGSEPSRSVGQKRGGEESIGHASGRRIVRLLRTDAADLGDADIAHMRRVIGFLARHLAQRPRGDVSHTRWRYSLMNWGHDPLK